MQIDVSDLMDFYKTPLGLATYGIIQQGLRPLWPSVLGQRVLGYGFTLPYLEACRGDAERIIAAMPAQMGIVPWPEGKNCALLVEEDAFAFPDAFFDKILVVHGLEGAESARVLLRQLWRVLAPEGILLLVAPNRTGLWAQVERSPFASGRPFRRGELDLLLREAFFTPEKWGHALYAPPLLGGWFLRDGTNWDRLGRYLWPGMAGVHIVRASKSLYAAATFRPKPAGPHLVPV